MGVERVESSDRRVALCGVADTAGVVAALRRGGWRPVPMADAPDAPIMLFDPGGPAAQVAAAVSRDRSAAVALVDPADPAAPARAYRAGATHWIAADDTDEAVAVAMDFAARHARRVGRHGRPGAERRAEPAGKLADRPLRNWIATRSESGPVTVIAIALTRFEFVNAAFGRRIGDVLLAAAEQRIGQWTEAALTGDSILVRRAGAATIVMATGDQREAIGTLETELSRPFEAAGAMVSLGSRVGVAISSPGESAAGLLTRVRRALTEAQRSHGATTRVAAAEGRAPIDRLAADLHHALERNEIRMLFQPQATLTAGLAPGAADTGTIVGVEALARWKHPVFGALDADSLFAAAERADLSRALSERIQALALSEAAAWPAPLAGLRLSINITASDLARPDFTGDFLRRIDASGLARGRITAEIVETGLIGQIDRAAAALAHLRGAGCRIAIDDFGTGYSSLAYLKDLPIDYLKIDRSLTHDIAGSERERIIVRGVIAIARSLGLDTIAEGVETHEERALLAAEGCDLYQGYLCSAPLTSEALATLLADPVRPG